MQLLGAYNVGQRQIQGGSKFVQRIWGGFKDQCITCLQGCVARLTVAAVAIADQSKDSDICFFCFVLKFRKAFANLLAAFGNC